MGLTYAVIELINQYDEYRSEEVLLPKDEIRRWSGEFMIDTGAIRMAINEDIKEKLGLKKGSPMVLMVLPVAILSKTGFIS